ncbi:MAG: glycosyltransferase [Kiritimatiellae bacterium]|nr:glycosyltransferase [Kiritimatiellia bacterium]
MISIIIPLYNEEDNVILLAGELKAIQVQVKDQKTEVLFIDDGSTDQTWKHIKTCMQKYKFVRGIQSAKNRGQSAAMLLGLSNAQGTMIVLMDGDLQNDPQDIPKLIMQLNACDVVCGYRSKRRDTWSRRIASRLANRIRNWVTQDGIRDTGCSLKIFKASCAQDIPPLDGVHRFLPAYFKLHGRTIQEMPVNHRPRKHGVSKYTNVQRLPKTLLDLFGFWWYRKRYLEEPSPTSKV